MSRKLIMLDKKGQATTELALMGSIVLMVLIFLAQQAFLYNARQGLEMYSFRQALQMSKNTGRGIDLTVSRDVVTPSFFAGINRQRITASTSVEANPYDLWVAEEDSPGDIPTLQLLQIGEAMISKGYFVQVPPTKIMVDDGSTPDPKPSWKTSSISKYDQEQVTNNPTYRPKETSVYTNIINTQENKTKKVTTANLGSKEQISTNIEFENANDIQEDYVKNDWEGKVVNASKVTVSNIPKNVEIILDEKLNRLRSVSTPN